MNFEISGGTPAHRELLNRILSEKTAGISGETKITLNIDRCGKDPDGYSVRGNGSDWSVTGYGDRGLFYGIGKFLHSASYRPDGLFPKETAGDVFPACSFRAMYFSIHFYNWYQQATPEELTEYVESLLLWGYGAIICIVPVINLSSFDEPLFYGSTAKIKKIFEICRRYGMNTGIIINPNQGLKSAPHEYDADLSFNQYLRGHAGRNLCTSIPDALEYMRTLWRRMLLAFRDTGIDYIVTWPYDEGGCGCEKCRPWGSNGYLRAFNALKEEVSKIYPDALYIMSTWTFDSAGDEGEYSGLWSKIREGKVDPDYLMIDAHQDFPEYPLEHAPVRPVVNFPEISMWGLYPWGGFGANPLPRRFERLWRSANRILTGGMPYSEGKFEDISKVQYAAYYWQPDRDYADILSEYAGYEFPGADPEKIVRICELIEKNHAGVYSGSEPDIETYMTAERLALDEDHRIGARARNSWRWRILLIRTLLDRKRYDHYYMHRDSEGSLLRLLVGHSGDMLKDDAFAQELMKELCGYYSCVDYNGENHYTHPPAGGDYTGKQLF